MSKLLDHLVEVGNRSGAIPAAPQGLLDMKKALESLPISVEIPGMSNLIQAENLVKGVVGLVKNLGSLGAVGDFGGLLRGISIELGVTDITQVADDLLEQAITRVVPLDQLKQAVGQATSITASLSGLASKIKQ